LPTRRDRSITGRLSGHVTVEVEDHRGQPLSGEGVQDAPSGDGLALPRDAEHEHVRAARGTDPPPHVGRVRVLPEMDIHGARQLITKGKLG
jgi:hypothetical protein